MKLLVIGGGGREHALTWKLRQSPAVDQIFCAPGNAGTAQVATNVPIAAGSIDDLLVFAEREQVDFTVVGPDDPLAAGMVDRFRAAGLRIFGPDRSAARLESSKSFAKQLMQSWAIPTARAGTFATTSDALNFARDLGFPVVIKADGLALGKGVVIAQDEAEASAALDAMLIQRQFGEAGSRVVVEQFLTGSECSVHALVSGHRARLLATARDHKRIGEGDTGPNTGGMGALSPADNWRTSTERQFEQSVLRPLVDALAKQGIDFRGLLFPGLMITGDGPHVLEFNCRFGDPETQAILPRLRSDLLPLLQSTADGSLANQEIEWDSRPAVTVVLAAGGYPGKYATGQPISGLQAAAEMKDVQIFHAGTRREDGRIVTAGGRVLAVTALGSDVTAARAAAYAAVAEISFEGMQYRRDIALPLHTR